jgi:predicted dehydrogenase
MGSIADARRLWPEPVTASKTTDWPEEDALRDPGKRLGAAVVGAGFFGQVHAQVWATLARRAAAGCDRQGQGAATSTGDAAWCRAYSDLREITDRDDIDLVSIVTPEPMHREPAVMAAEAGKHILRRSQSRPPGRTAGRSWRRRVPPEVKLAIGFESRFALGYAQIKQAIDGGSLGEVSYVYAKRRGDRSFADLKAGRVNPDPGDRDPRLSISSSGTPDSP